MTANQSILTCSRSETSIKCLNSRPTANCGTPLCPLNCRSLKTHFLEKIRRGRATGTMNLRATSLSSDSSKRIRTSTPNSATRAAAPPVFPRYPSPRTASQRALRSRARSRSSRRWYRWTTSNCTQKPNQSTSLSFRTSCRT
jgi:hypothetical protein